MISKEIEEFMDDIDRRVELMQLDKEKLVNIIRELEEENERLCRRLTN